MKKGIDVSYAQGKIDWAHVKAAGVQFAMIRSSYGKNRDQVDARLADNVAGCEQQGIPYGFYHYTYADTPDRARLEAQFFLDTVAPYSPAYPLVVDVEDATLASLSKSALTAAALAFIESIKAAGYKAMVYASASWLKTKLDTAAIEAAGATIWLAQWASKPTYTGKYDIWQHSSTGRVDGISGNVDLNVGYIEYQAADVGSIQHCDTDEPSAPDNTPDSYAADAVAWAVNSGILLGNDKGDYMLHSAVTRQDLLVLLHRTLGV